jgi:hypothetical protein
MSDWLETSTRESQRASGGLQDFVFEIPLESGQGSDRFEGTVLLVLERRRSMHAEFSGHEAEYPGKDENWHYRVRTRHGGGNGDVVAEPFSGGALPFAVTGLGSYDRPERGYDPDRLGAGLLAYFSDWRRPQHDLTAEQREWFRRFGPALATQLPGSTEETIAWLAARRTADSDC